MSHGDNFDGMSSTVTDRLKSMGWQYDSLMALSDYIHKAGIRHKISLCYSHGDLLICVAKPHKLKNGYLNENPQVESIND